MRIQELFETDQSVTELSYTDPGIRKHLLALKYKPAGQGGDQSTWLAPDGSILKIFGTQRGQQGITGDHKMFIAWYKYANAHKTNPFMPKFFGWETFKVDHEDLDKNVVPHTYIQYKMERLSPITDQNTQNILDLMDIQVEKGWPYARFIALVDRTLGPKITDTMEPLIKTLYPLVEELNRIAKKNGWGLDAHADNYMMRGNQLVIVDPWVASD